MSLPNNINVLEILFKFINSTIFNKIQTATIYNYSFLNRVIHVWIIVSQIQKWSPRLQIIDQLIVMRINRHQTTFNVGKKEKKNASMVG